MRPKMLTNLNSIFLGNSNIRKPVRIEYSDERIAVVYRIEEEMETHLGHDGSRKRRGETFK